MQRLITAAAALCLAALAFEATAQDGGPFAAAKAAAAANQAALRQYTWIQTTQHQPQGRGESDEGRVCSVRTRRNAAEDRHFGTAAEAGAGHSGPHSRAARSRPQEHARKRGRADAELRAAVAG